MKSNRYVIALMTLAICLLGATAMAGGVKERMLERVPAINVLKAEGIVGENSQGYLEFRGPQKQADMVQAENADRAKVYEAIGQKTGAEANVVGQRRAAQIAQQAPGGTWLQSPNGNWYQK